MGYWNCKPPMAQSTSHYITPNLLRRSGIPPLVLAPQLPASPPAAAVQSRGVARWCHQWPSITSHHRPQPPTLILTECAPAVSSILITFKTLSSGGAPLLRAGPDQPTTVAFSFGLGSPFVFALFCSVIVLPNSKTDQGPEAILAEIESTLLTTQTRQLHISGGTTLWTEKGFGSLCETSDQGTTPTSCLGNFWRAALVLSPQTHKSVA